MKSKLTSIGSIAATVVLTSAVGFAQDSVTRDARQQQPAAVSPSPLGSSAAHQNQFEGKIVSLFDYLSGRDSTAGASASSSSSSSTSASRAASSAATTATPATSPSSERTTSDQTRREPSASVGGASATSGAGSAFSGSAAWAGQPLALVIQPGSSASSGSTSPAGQRTPLSTALSEEGTPAVGETRIQTDVSKGQSALNSGRQIAGAGSSSGGEVYVLVFDPQNADSRAAFTKAQWLISGRASGSALSSTTTDSSADRLPVRGVGDATSPDQQTRTTTATSATRDQDSQRNQSDLNRAPQDQTRTYAASGHQAQMGGKHVTITGKVLNKGGIKAIEVASIEDGSSPAGVSGSPASDGLRTLPSNKE